MARTIVDDLSFPHFSSQMIVEWTRTVSGHFVTVIEFGMHAIVLNPGHVEHSIKCTRANSYPNRSSSGRALVLRTCVNLRQHAWWNNNTWRSRGSQRNQFFSKAFATFRLSRDFFVPSRSLSLHWCQNSVQALVINCPFHHWLLLLFSFQLADGILDYHLNYKILQLVQMYREKMGPQQRPWFSKNNIGLHMLNLA